MVVFLPFLINMYDISWNEFEKLTIDLSKKIKLSNIKFDFIICVSRGGLLLGRLLSEILSLQLGVISAKTMGIDYKVDPKISSLKEPIGNILLVDDFFEENAYEIVDVIKKINPKIKNIFLACIFYRSTKDFQPKFYINHIKEELWVSFPYQNKSLKKHSDL
jgi:uncharacterized protein